MNRMYDMLPSIVINDVLSELRAENDRLSGELVFANKCLHVLLKFKHYFYKNYLNVNNSNTQCYQTINESLNALNGNNSDNDLKELENEFDVLLRERNAKMYQFLNDNEINNDIENNEEIINDQIIDNREELPTLFVSNIDENTSIVNEIKSKQIIDNNITENNNVIKSRGLKDIIIELKRRVCDKKCEKKTKKTFGQE